MIEDGLEYKCDEMRAIFFDDTSVLEQLERVIGHVKLLYFVRLLAAYGGLVVPLDTRLVPLR